MLAAATDRIPWQRVPGLPANGRTTARLHSDRHNPQRPAGRHNRRESPLRAPSRSSADAPATVRPFYLHRSRWRKGLGVTDRVFLPVETGPPRGFPVFVARHARAFPRVVLHEEGGKPVDVAYGSPGLTVGPATRPVVVAGQYPGGTLFLRPGCTNSVSVQNPGGCHCEALAPWQSRRRSSNVCPKVSPAPTRLPRCARNDTFPASLNGYQIPAALDTWPTV